MSVSLQSPGGQPGDSLLPRVAPSDSVLTIDHSCIAGKRRFMAPLAQTFSGLPSGLLEVSPLRLSLPSSRMQSSLDVSSSSTARVALFPVIARGPQLAPISVSPYAKPNCSAGSVLSPHLHDTAIFPPPHVPFSFIDDDLVSELPTCTRAELLQAMLQANVPVWGTDKPIEPLCVLGRGRNGLCMAVKSCGKLYAQSHLSGPFSPAIADILSIPWERSLVCTAVQIIDFSQRMVVYTRPVARYGSLARVVELCGSIPLTCWKQMMKLLLLSLAELHKHGIVHRDIKPDNVVIDSDGSCYLADFEHAKRIDEELRPHTSCGTTMFLSPERAMSRPYNQSADLWALGATMLFALLGSASVPKLKSFELLCSAFSQPYWNSLLVENKEKLPPLLYDLLSSAMDTNPSHRLSVSQLLMHEALADVVIEPQTELAEFLSRLDCPLHNFHEDQNQVSSSSTRTDVLSGRIKPNCHSRSKPT